MASCITVVLNQFFEAEGETIEEARRRVRDEVEKWLRKTHPEVLESYGRIEIEVLCTEV